MTECCEQDIDWNRWGKRDNEKKIFTSLFPECFDENAFTRSERRGVSFHTLYSSASYTQDSHFSLYFSHCFSSSILLLERLSRTRIGNIGMELAAVVVDDLFRRLCQLVAGKHITEHSQAKLCWLVFFSSFKLHAMSIETSFLYLYISGLLAGE